MRRVALVVWALVAVALQILSAQAPAIPVRPVQPGGIPVRRVVLYKNGIGYFEHVGRVAGTQLAQQDPVVVLRRETDAFERRRHDAQVELASLIESLTTDVAVAP